MLSHSFRLDGKGIFQVGFTKIRSKLEKRFYISVSTFSADFGTVFSSVIGLPTTGPSLASDVQSQVHGTTFTKDLSSEQKDRRKLAKRIVKAVQNALEDATRKEGELCRKPFEKELKELDLLLENSILSRRDSLGGSLAENLSDDEPGETKLRENGHEVVMAIANGERIKDRNFVEVMEEDTRDPQDKGELTVADVISKSLQEHANGSDAEVATLGEKKVSTSDLDVKWPAHQVVSRQGSDVIEDPVPLVNGVGDTVSNRKGSAVTVDVNEPSHQSSAMSPVPSTPPLSSDGDPWALLSYGGIPWYMDPFDPVGTTIHEERWTGRDVVRGMSEELSDMDEEELQGLVGEGMTDAAQEGADGSSIADSSSAALPARRKSGAKRRRWRGFR